MTLFLITIITLRIFFRFAVHILRLDIMNLTYLIIFDIIRLSKWKISNFFRTRRQVKILRCFLIMDIFVAWIIKFRTIIVVDNLRLSFLNRVIFLNLIKLYWLIFFNIHCIIEFVKSLIHLYIHNSCLKTRILWGYTQFIVKRISFLAFISLI